MEKNFCYHAMMDKRHLEELTLYLNEKFTDLKKSLGNIGKVNFC